MTDVSALDHQSRSFLAEARTATMATIAPSGRPRLVPICFIVAPAAAGTRARLYSPLDDKPKQVDDPHELARVRDILVLPEATLLVDRWSEDWSRLSWIRLDTRAVLMEPEPREAEEHAAAVEALRAKYPQYATHRLEDSPIVRFTVIRTVSWGTLDPG